jgi:hypothetical protein
MLATDSQIKEGKKEFLFKVETYKIIGSEIQKGCLIIPKIIEI